MDPPSSPAAPAVTGGAGDDRFGRLLAELARLRQTASTWADCFHHAPTALVLTDDEGQVREANWAFAALVGRSPEELVRLSLGDLVPGTWAERLHCLLDGLAADGRGPWEIDLLRNDGVRRVVELTASRLAPGRHLLQAKDVTRRRSQDADARAEQERWRFALDGAGDGVWDWSVADDTCWYSDGFARLAGTTGGMLAPRLEAWLQRTHPEDGPALRSALADCAEGRSDRLAVDHRLTTADGGWRWVATRGAVLARDGSGLALRLAGLLTDLEPVKRAEARLEALSTRQGAFLRAVPDLLLVIGRDCRVRELLGRRELSPMPAEQVLGRALSEFLPSAIANQAEAKMRDAFTTGQVVEWDFVREDVTPTRAWQVRMTAVDGDELLAALTDRTQAKELEDRLRQGEKMEAMGQLAAGITHDFNNLLAGIIGYADLLQGACADDPRRQRHVNAISQAAGRAAELTARLLAFSRKGTAAPVAVELHDAIRATLEILRRTIDPRIGLVTDLEAERHSVLGDKARIQSALLNLGVNARDAMPRGGTFTVATANVVLPASGAPALPAGLYCRIELSDTGEGMREEVQARIFEPFYTTKATGQGTGLGLSAVHGTVLEMGGAIAVSSVPGAGTTFTIWLPVCESQKVAGTTTARLKKLHGHGRILVVDDEELLRELAEELLSELGYEVTTARDGVEAIERYKASPHGFDLVLLDLVMPRMTGVDCCEALRRHDPAARVVMMTGMADSAQLSRARDLGVIATVAKPYSAAVLAQAVHDAIGLPAG